VSVLASRSELPSTASAEAGAVLRLGAGPSWLTAFTTVYVQQFARVRVARAPLLFVAGLQSVGILLLLRGVVDSENTLVRSQVVAGSTVLVVGFVALNLLAQRFGAMRSGGSLDYYGALPVPPSAVVLGTAASYATMAVPATVITAVLGTLLYQLPVEALWLLLPVVPLAGASLAGLGALLGLLAPRPELATVAGQLGMSAVLFLSIIPATKLPLLLRPLRAVVPSTYAADALAAGLRPAVDWVDVTTDLGVCAAVAVVALLLGSWALRRAYGR
jgi:ABC-2 type transport system permease protein